MANQSIIAAFERMWQHITSSLNNKSDKSEVEALQTLVGDTSVSEQIESTVANLDGYIYAEEFDSEATMVPLNADTLGGQLPSYYAKATKLTPRNLLDNSDFRNPVNQRGLTSYSGAVQYTIDRWKITNVNTTVDISNGILNISNSTADSAGYFLQIIENPNRLLGKKVTLATELENGSIICASATLPSAFPSANTQYAILYDNGLTIGAVLLATSQIWVRIWSNASENTRSFKWAALYEGEYTAETLPEYQPKGYGAELLECQRYYFQSWDGATIGTAGIIVRRAFTTTRLMPVDFPITMRVTPTIKIFTSDGVEGKVKEWNSGTVIDTTSVVHAAYQSAQRFTPSIGSAILEAEKEYSFHYSASAEL